MIAGIGIDLCRVSRMAELYQDGRFLRRYFAEEEQAYIHSRGKGSAQSMAGIFAAKEALVKAFGTGITGMELKDICVLHDSCGAPYYDLRGQYAEAAAARGISHVFLSITHEEDTAAAVAVAEKNG